MLSAELQKKLTKPLALQSKETFHTNTESVNLRFTWV